MTAVSRVSSGEKAIWIAVGMLASTLAAVPTAQADVVLALDWAGEDTNELVITPGVLGSAVTLLWTDRGSNETTVVIKNPPTPYQNYSLRIPRDKMMWNNATLQPNGDLVFPGIPIVDKSGDWKIFGDGAEILHFPMSGQAVSGNPRCGNSYDIEARKTFWTPVVVAHAPFKGTGTAGSSTGKASFFETEVSGNDVVKASEAKETSFEQGTDIAVSNGLTAGNYQQAEWARANVWTTCCPNSVQGDCSTFQSGETVFMDKAIAVTLTGKDLSGPSEETDSDDLESFTHNSVPSIRYKNRYANLEHVVDHQGGADSTHSYDEAIVLTVGGDLTISGNTFNIAYKWRYKESSSNHGSIKFRSGDPICVAIDWLRGGETGPDWDVRPAFDTLTEQECADAQTDIILNGYTTVSDIKYGYA